jgi:hypothetical protein
MALQFDERTHTYTLDGSTLPSVTEILEAAGLVDYSFIPPATRQMALDRGSAVHQATAFDDEGDLDEASVPDNIMPYIQGWRKFKQDEGAIFEQIEHRGYHPQFQYAGTKDRRVRLPRRSKSPFDLDIKCGKAQPWVWIQIAAYQGMDPEPRRVLPFCVELPGDGTWREYPRPADWSFDRYFNYFLSCLTVVRLQQTCGTSRRRAA